jgi:hypothetical protein
MTTLTKSVIGLAQLNNTTTLSNNHVSVAPIVLHLALMTMDSSLCLILLMDLTGMTLIKSVLRVAPQLLIFPKLPIVVLAVATLIKLMQTFAINVDNLNTMIPFSHNAIHVLNLVPAAS